MEDGAATQARRDALQAKPRRASSEHSPLVALAVRRAQAGERGAFAFLYSRFADDVCRYATSILHDSHEAEEVTQQVFTKLFSIICKYEQREVPFLAWMLRVTRNVAMDELRRRRTIPVAEVRLADERLPRRGRSDGRELLAALRALPLAQREVLVLRHVVGLSPAEIAAETGRSEASVHGLHHRGRKRLTAELSAQGVAPVTKVPAVALSDATGADHA
jgi:RNA polymerase sigma-70 factor, ECF subfamily